MADRLGCHVMGVALPAHGPAMFWTELSLIVALSKQLEQRAKLNADAAVTEEVQQMHANILYYQNELTPLSTHGVAASAAAATAVRPNVQAALDYISVSSECHALLRALLSRIDAEIAKFEFASSPALEAQLVAQPIPVVASSSPSSNASVATTQCSASSSSGSTLASPPQNMSSPDSDCDPLNAPNARLLQLARMVQSRAPLPAGAPMSGEDMRLFADGKIGLRVITLEKGAVFKFEVKVANFQPVAVYKALAHLVNEAYVDGATKNRLDCTESAEAWALVQLVREYQACLARLDAPAKPRIPVKRQLKVENDAAATDSPFSRSA